MWDEGEGESSGHNAYEWDGGSVEWDGRSVEWDGVERQCVKWGTTKEY